MVSGKGRLWVAAIIAMAVVVMAAVIVLYPHETNVLSEGDGTVTPEGSISMRFNETLHLEIVPDEGLTAYVYVDGRLEAEGATSFDFKTSALDLNKHTIKVVFGKPSPPTVQHVLTVTSEGEGTVTPAGTTSHAEGSTVTISSIPGTGNVVQDVLVDGTSVGTDWSTMLTMDSDHEVKVVFRPVTPTDIPVTVSVDVDLDIIVETLGASRDYGQVLPNGTVYIVPHGSLTVTIVLNPGFEVIDLSVDGTSFGSITEHTITDITRSVDIRVSIVEKVQGFVIKASAGNGGTITPSGDVKVEKGTDMTFRFSASSGYTVSNVIVDGATVTGVSGSYTFKDVQGAHTIEVTFRSTGGGGGGGSDRTLTGISVGGSYSTSYYDGDPFDIANLTVTAIYSDGSRIPVISGYTVDPSVLHIGDDTVTVSYQGFTASITVTVSEPPVVTGIYVHTGPDKTTYMAGEDFDPEGMVVYARFSDSSESPVTGYTWSPGTFLDDEQNTVTISYTDGGNTFSCSLTLTVRGSDKLSVTVTSYQGTKVTDGGSIVSFSHTGMTTELKDFSFNLTTMVPGMMQTLTIDIWNQSGHDLDLALYKNITECSASLSEQVRLMYSTGSIAGSYTLDRLIGGEHPSLGCIRSGDRLTLELTLEFMDHPNNNDVMGEPLRMQLGIFASA